MLGRQGEVGVHTVGAERQHLIEFHGAPGITPVDEVQVKAVGHFGVRRGRGRPGMRSSGDRSSGCPADDVVGTGERRVVRPGPRLRRGRRDEDVVAFHHGGRKTGRGASPGLRVWADRSDRVGSGTDGDAVVGLGGVESAAPYWRTSRAADVEAIGLIVEATSDWARPVEQVSALSRGRGRRRCTPPRRRRGTASREHRQRDSTSRVR